MFEDSPRATKRRKLTNSNVAAEIASTLANGQRSRSTTPGFIAAESRSDNELDQLTGDATLMSTKQALNNGRGTLQEVDQPEAHLLETPSKLRTVRFAGGQSDGGDGEVQLLSGQRGREGQIRAYHICMQWSMQYGNGQL